MYKLKYYAKLRHYYIYNNIVLHFAHNIIVNDYVLKKTIGITYYLFGIISKIFVMQNFNHIFLITSLF